MDRDQTIKVCHLMSGDLWAGAEVQLFTLLTALKNHRELDLSVVLLNEGKLAEKLRDGAVDVTVIEERKHNFKSLRRQLLRTLEDRGIDILHSHRYKENILAATVQRRCRIKSLVQTVHGGTELLSGLGNLKMKAYLALNRRISRNSFDRVIAVSQDISEQMSNTYSNGQLVMIHNAVNTEGLKPSRTAMETRSEFGFDDDHLVLGTAGRMVPVKGYDLLLKAFKQILGKMPNARLILAGDGPLKSDLEKLAKKLGMSGEVRLVGFRDDIIDIINCLDVFVMSSHNEGIPMVLLEAMTLGKPVVTTSVGGIREVVVDGESGILVPANDSARLADACVGVLTDQTERERLGDGSRKRVKEEFSADTMADRVSKLYSSLVVA